METGRPELGWIELGRSGLAGSPYTVAPPAPPPLVVALSVGQPLMARVCVPSAVTGIVQADGVNLPVVEDRTLGAVIVNTDVLVGGGR